MGREARCEAALGDASGTVKAHLDADAVRIRGAFRLDAAFGDIRELNAHGGTLRFHTPAGAVMLALGEGEAEKWFNGISQPKSLLDKLGVKAGMRVCVRGIDARIAQDLRERLGTQPATALRGRFGAIFAQIDEPKALASLPTLRDHLDPDGMLWLIAPKGKSSPVPEAMLRQAFLAAGLVDVKVAAYSATHTAVKVVIPRASRAKPLR
jgi:hypothetical protein